MDVAFNIIAAGLIMHALHFVWFIALAVVVTAIACPIRAWWRWYKRRLTGET